MTMFEVYSRINELAKKKGVSLQKVATDIGLSENYIYNLKSKKTANTDPIEKIANYFQVSTDYLLGRTDNPNIATVNNQKTVDLKKAIAGSMSYDGKPLTEDEINYLADVFELHMKMKDK